MNKYIDSLLLDLLKLATKITSPEEVIANFPKLNTIEWEELRKAAKGQSIEALIYEAINMLPTTKQPDLYWRMKWIGDSIKIERHNIQLQKTLIEITDIFDHNNIPFVLLKGFASASRYPNPMHRNGGDIDLLILDNKFDEACSLLTSHGAKRKESAPEKHNGYYWSNGTVIEIHHLLVDLCHPKALKYIQELDYSQEIETIDIMGKKIQVFRPEFDCAYQLTHIIHHLMSSGVGLRQTCDWMLLMYHKGEEMDTLCLLNHLKRLHHLEAFFTFVLIGAKHFNLPFDIWGWALCNASPRIADRTFAQILKNGNFGKITASHQDHHTIKGNFVNMKNYIKNNIRFYWLCPAEARWFILSRSFRFIKKKQSDEQNANA